MRCEKQHYHEIDTPFITKYLWFTFNPSSINNKNDKVIKTKLSKNGVNVRTCLSHFCNENMSIRVKIE